MLGDFMAAGKVALYITASVEPTQVSPVISLDLPDQEELAL